MLRTISKAVLLAASLFIGVLNFGLGAWAQTPASLTVSAAEKSEYLRNSRLISETATRCLNNTWNTHQEFFNRYKISKYYGDRNPNLNTREKRLAVIRRVGAPESIIDQLEPTSCIGLTRKCLKQGFDATNSPAMQSLWSRIDRNLVANGSSGMVLIQHLQKLGWKVLYWNPAPQNNARWDAEDPTLTTGKPVTWNSGVRNAAGQFIYHSAWGMHAARYNTVMNRNIYYDIRVDDKQTLVGHGSVLPDSFRAHDFFVGTAHAGYHVFPGFNGQVIEAHSMRRLDAFDNLEVGEFNPLAPGGAPRWTAIEKYRSGIVAVPPIQ